MNELERIEQLINSIHKKVHLAQLHKQDKVNIDITTLEELIDIINDSLRTIKEYDAKPFDHTLPIPPKRLN